VSPSEQRERIEATCERDGLTLIAILEELDVSGGAALASRPQLTRAIEMIEAGEAHVIVVAYFDRLVRSLTVQLELVGRVEAADGQILAADVGEVHADSASGWITSTMLGTVAEYQRRVTAERTAEGKRRAVARGVAPFPNLPPYLRRGEDEQIELEPRNARVVREAVRRRVEGAPIREVRAYLAKHGIRRSFHGVQSLLSSRMLLGELRFGKLLNEDAFPALIDAETWQRLQQAFVPRGRRPKSERLLARLGVLRCGTCGARMVVGTSQGRYSFYRCPPVGDCPRRAHISAERAEETVAAAVRELLADVTGTASLADGVAEANRELEQTEAALNAAIRAFDGFGDVEATRERLSELRACRDSAHERVADLRAAAAPAITLSASGDWADLTIDERRALIAAVITRADVASGRGSDRITIQPRS
jgi:site-specific DNA recombinase